MTEEERKAIEELEEFLKRQFSDFSKLCCGHGTINLTQIGSIDKILRLIKKQQKEIEDLHKYDSRKIKIDAKDEIKSPSFTKEQLDLMNLGVALSKSFGKLFNDESEETDK